jgi:hypothetical protein
MRERGRAAKGRRPIRVLKVERGERKALKAAISEVLGVRCASNTCHQNMRKSFKSQREVYICGAPLPLN